MTDSNKKVYLVDGSGYIFRAYYAVAPLSTRDDFPTNALFGFTRMLVKLLSEFDSQYIVMVFDAGRITFRNEIYAEYKANREECPEDLAKQMPYFREISAAMGLPILELPGFEADDVIGTLTERLSAAGIDTVIISGDKDLMQLVEDGVSIWDTMRDVRYGAKEVEGKMGVPPTAVVEYLALAGDSSDNVPGLKGVGPKTAVQLIEKFGNVETILNSAEAIREDKQIRNRKKISERIELEGDLLRLSRRLVEIRRDAPVLLTLRDSEPVSGGQPGDGNRGMPVEISELTDDQLLQCTERSLPDQVNLQRLVDKFEFSSLMKDLNLDPVEQVERDEANYTTVMADAFDSWCDNFFKQSEFTFDVETTSLNVLEAKPVGMAVCWAADQAFYIPIAHEQEGKLLPNQVTWDAFCKQCGAHFQDPKIRKAGQNLKYDLSVLAVNGLRVEGVAFDTMVAAYLLSPERSSFSLGALAHDYLRMRVSEFKDVVGDDQSFANVSIPKATQYAAEDAHVSWLLERELRTRLDDLELSRVFEQIEVPLVSVLSGMELMGVELDVKLLSEMSEELGNELARLQAELFKLAGGEFNVNSPKQLAEILFNKLGIPTKGVKKTKTGFSTDSSVLEKLKHDYPLPELVLEYRGLHKLKSTYVDALPSQISPFTGRLHSRFNQTVTATGRLSSSDPNLQNIPIQTEQGRRVREAFVPKQGDRLISADYSQIELRLLAHMSGDKNLIAAFRDGLDIHSITARDIMNLPSESEVTPDLRRIGKTINFGIIYGMSGFRLGRDLGIPVGVANEYIENYFAQYPDVQVFFETLEEQAEKEGFVTTLFGRKRFVSEIEARGRDRGFVRRAALNAPFQGTAADIIKLAMVKLYQRQRNEELPFDLLLQIHDELVFECRTDVVPQMMELIQGEMEGVVELDVPLQVDIQSGCNWLEAH